MLVAGTVCLPCFGLLRDPDFKICSVVAMYQSKLTLIQ